MARTTFLVSLFAVFLGNANFIAASAPLAPEEIKRQIENATSYSYSYGYTYQKTYADVAQDVLTSKSLAALCKKYTLSDILGWQGGSSFFYEITSRAAQEQEKDLLLSTLVSSNDIMALYNAQPYNFAYTMQNLLSSSSEIKAKQCAALLYTANQSDSRIFSTLIPSISDETTRQRLSSSIKLHIQNQLKIISLHTILNETTPSALHMFADYNTTYTITQDLTGNYNYYKTQIAQLLCTAIQDEKKLINNGYSVFFHSQRWDYLFVEKLYTDLWALTKHKKRTPHYIFPHVRIKQYDPLAKAALNRATILQQGRTDMLSRHVLLFVNNSLFGKYKIDPHSSALHFFLSNSNINNLTISTEQVFEHYNLEKLFKKHRAELTALQKWYDQARTFGTLLMIAIPKTMVKNYCYAAIPYGYKNPSAPNIETFLDELASKKSNKLNNEEFCIVMLDEAMNPEGGFLIKAYHCAESTAYKQFEAGYEKLITQLQKEVAAI